MEEYSCPRCGYVTDVSQRYVTHIRRKRLCDSVVSNISLEDEYDKHMKLKEKFQQQKKEERKKKQIFTCNICNKTLSTKQVLNNHMKKCINKQKKKNDNDDKQDSDVNQQDSSGLKDIINEQKKQLEIQKEQFDELKEIIKSNKSIVNNVSIQNALINNGNIINFNAFDKTDCNMLSNKKILKCMQNKINCVPSLIEQTHFGDYAENMNVLLLNHEDRFCKVHNGEQWVLMKTDEVIHELVDKNSCMLSQIIDEWKNKKKFPDEIKKFDAYIDSAEDERFVKTIKDNVLIILYNNSNKIVNLIMKNGKSSA